MDENINLIWSTLESIKNNQNKYIINSLQFKLKEFEFDHTELNQFLEEFLKE